MTDLTRYLELADRLEARKCFTDWEFRCHDHCECKGINFAESASAIRALVVRELEGRLKQPLTEASTNVGTARVAYTFSTPECGHDWVRDVRVDMCPKCSTWRCDDYERGRLEPKGMKFTRKEAAALAQGKPGEADEFSPPTSEQARV